MPQSRFHIITENVQVEHIAQKVHPSTVEEGGGKKRKKRKVKQLWCLGDNNGHSRRDNPEDMNEVLQIGPKGQLVQKNQYISPDEGIGDKGKCSGGDVVAQRDQ